VLGQQHHRQVRALLADLPGGAGSIGCHGGRHPYVDDGEVGLVRYDGVEEGGGIGHSEHLVAGFGQQPGESFPEQCGVVRDEDAHVRSSP
jgi:hypothetical protein